MLVKSKHNQDLHEKLAVAWPSAQKFGQTCARAKNLAKFGRAKNLAKNLLTWSRWPKAKLFPDPPVEYRLYFEKKDTF